VTDSSLAALRDRQSNPIYRWGIRPIPIDPKDYLGSGQLVEIEYGRVHVETVGDGPDILALPGFAGTAGTWRAVAEHLKQDYRLHLLDFLGYGLSEKPPGIDHSRIGQAHQIQQTMDAMGLKKCVLMSNSASAASSLYAQFRTPRRISTNIMVAPFVSPTKIAKMGLKILRLPFAKQILQTLLGFRPLVFMANYTGRSDRSGITPAIVDEQFLAFGTPGIWDSIGEIGKHLAPTALNGIIQMNTIPTLVVWGSDDRAGDLMGTRRLLGQIPGMQFEILEPCGHIIQEERPAELARIISKFLDEQSVK
jgi:pimeloyl-ACP methyl ester carboxylesterase